MDRPWAVGLARMLAERRLKKGDLAALSPGAKGKTMRAGNISAILNSPRTPDIATLQGLLVGFTRFDRGEFDAKKFPGYHQAHKPNAPAVQLWEFFVSDEQASLLRASASKQHELVSQEGLLDRAVARVVPLLKAALDHEVAASLQQHEHEPVAHPKKKHA